MNMDDLDEQLKQLSLINGRLSVAVANNEATPENRHIGVAKLVSNIEERNNLSSTQIYNTTNKKVGPPLVPPKPHKKPTTFLENQDENHYETTTVGAGFAKQPLLLRKQSSTSSIISPPGVPPLLSSPKVTLDNPAILEQQLEALEHHKKQLEKMGKITNRNDSATVSKSKLSTIPKLSSTSLLSDVTIKPQLSLDGSSATYANMRRTNSPSLLSPGGGGGSNSIKNNLYSNVGNIYSNLQPSSTSQSLTDPGDGGIYYAQNLSMLPEDEIPPPPSPVSSSYSELRRATEVFKTNNAAHKPIAASNDQMCIAKPVSGYGLPLDHKAHVAGNESRYINKQYISNMGYNNYNNMQQVNSAANSDFYGYGGFSQTSSTYESIYEPINPRPPSQMSNNSNNAMYPSCLKGVGSIGSMPPCAGILSKSNSSNLSLESAIDPNMQIYPKPTRDSASGILGPSSSRHKEDEVEALTDYLVQSMGSPQDLESYGICYKCKERVVGENSGCTAMDQIYHIACFTCSQCALNLQGKPFYTLDGKPYCEYDYLQTLEKCSVCMNPILERILRATGKPYHPQCFTCVVCKKSLDGVPFTVDATNQNYCIEDFHRKFAPCCCVCKEPIMPEPGETETVRVVALDRSFHFECYKCEDCGLLLSSEAEGRGCYPLDDHVLCKSCNAKRVQILTNQMLGNTTEL
ncbi:lipoma-preferred partner [Musca domestica]|uniref:Lipoma-preferred partner n=1 Tax=Musca domestica TaxID=7370 RepID=A0A1I8NAC3_MUSDO|nr:lipoma-preferred partner [Musca domestica]